jgi:hypothetical protein
MIIGNSGVAKFDINERGRSIDIVPGTPPGRRTGRSPVEDPPGSGKFPILEASFKNMDDWMKQHNLTFNKSGRIVSK